MHNRMQSLRILFYIIEREIPKIKAACTQFVDYNVQCANKGAKIRASRGEMNVVTGDN